MKLTLDLFKIIEKYPVHWGDMDSANHVNNLVYLRWAESARIKYFEKMGMDTSFSSVGTGPILGWQECKYIFPMTYPDTAIVGARTVEITEDRFFIECAIFSERHNRIAAISKQSIIPYSYGELKKVEMPDPWLEEIAKIEGS
ncbi:MAG: thioesterase family protein [Bacteroidetes bacterium]|jgi:acyl-CoA thioester hydrolase|nr:thioesterase family protein [Bacteroidota bacterium]MDF1868674.1 thioesterase family protein [Saprospiraceae bacterium]